MNSKLKHLLEEQVIGTADGPNQSRYQSGRFELENEIKTLSK